MADFEEIIRKHVDDNGNIPTTAINAIVTAIRNTVGNEFVDKERYKAKLTEIDTLKEQVKTAEDNATTAEKWKTKYEGIKADFESYKKDVATKETHNTKRDAFRDLLKEIGISEKRIDSVLKVSDVDGIELDADGKIKGGEDLKKSLAEEWSDFISTTQTVGANISNPPGNHGGSYKTVDEIMSIKDDAERQAAIAENHTLFGF